MAEIGQRILSPSEQPAPAAQQAAVPAPITPEDLRSIAESLGDHKDDGSCETCRADRALLRVLADWLEGR